MLLFLFSKFSGLLSGEFSRSIKSLFGQWVIGERRRNDSLRPVYFSFPVYKNCCVSGDCKGVRVAKLIVSWCPITKPIYKIRIPTTPIPNIETIITFPEAVVYPKLSQGGVTRNTGRQEFCFRDCRNLRDSWNFSKESQFNCTRSAS